MEIKPNNIYCGDCYKLIKEMPDKSVDLILTDPPYDFEDSHKSGILRTRKQESNCFAEIRRVNAIIRETHNPYEFRQNKRHLERLERKLRLCQKNK